MLDNWKSTTNIRDFELILVGGSTDDETTGVWYFRYSNDSSAIKDNGWDLVSNVREFLVAILGIDKWSF